MKKIKIIQLVNGKARIQNVLGDKYNCNWVIFQGSKGMEHYDL